MSISTERIPVSKGTRFDVFLRDSFTCRYCGKHPPNVKLVIDHVKPIKEGGTNRISNLATCCEECNQGKAAKRILPQENEVEEGWKALVEMVKDETFQQYFKKNGLTKNDAISLIELGINLIGDSLSRWIHVLEKIVLYDTDEICLVACEAIADKITQAAEAEDE